MRGKVLEGVTEIIKLGITPAHAGKSAIYNNAFTAARDHPRACGEKRCTSAGLYMGIGSPPRMRGKD